MSYYFIIMLEVRENVISIYYCTSKTWLPQVTSQTSSTNFSQKLTPRQSNPGETKSMEATTPELGLDGLWSPKSSTFSGSNSIVLE